MHDFRAEFQSVSRTHTGSVRKHNEDSLLDRADMGLWAVADGMGGHAAGDIASALVVDRMNRLGPRDGAPFVDSVREALTDANAELYRRGSAVSPDHTMGATVVALGTDGKGFFCLWAGDSRLYRFRGGKLARLTRDHRYIQDLLDSGMLRESEAENHPRRSVITRAVGTDAELDLDLCEGAIELGDVFLLATDGVTEVCTDEQISEILSGTSLETAADHIVALCLSRGAPDNLTLILVRRQSG